MRVPPARLLFPAEDRAEVLRQIDRAMETGQLTLGPVGKELETAFAQRHGTKHAIAVSSGTSALEIILRSLDVTGREVIVPANTFFATAAAAVHAGATVRFADCDPETMALDVAHVESLIGPETAAVVVVHIGGLVTPAIGALSELCRSKGVHLVEDAAHAHGSAFDGRSAGQFGIAASFSFYPTKVIAGGEGGIIVTDDDTIAEEALVYRDQGKGSFLANFHTRLGHNWRMSEPHAAIVLSQLRRLDEFVERRQELARRYDAAFEPDGVLHRLGMRRLVVPAGAECNYYKYIVFLPDGVERTALKQLLRDEYEVGLSGEVYDTPLHHQPVFAPAAEAQGIVSLPGAEYLCARHVCLPLYPALSDDDADYVIESVAAALATVAVELDLDATPDSDAEIVR